jgi:hypothetical protein
VQYKLNGVNVPVQPSESRWVAPTPLGEDGNGHPIYPEIYEFEMHWGVLEPAEWTSIYGFFYLAGTTGTTTATIQCFTGTTVDEDATYTGCIVRQPERGNLIAGYILNSQVVISGIRVR